MRARALERRGCVPTLRQAASARLSSMSTTLRDRGRRLARRRERRGAPAARTVHRAGLGVLLRPDPDAVLHAVSTAGAAESVSSYRTHEFANASTVAVAEPGSPRADRFRDAPVSRSMDRPAP